MCHVKLLPRRNAIISNIYISTVGTENLVANASVMYDTETVPSYRDLIGRIPEEVLCRPKFRNFLQQPDADEALVEGLLPKDAAAAVVDELWALEREIWADRSNAGMDAQELAKKMAKRREKRAKKREKYNQEEVAALAR